MALTVNPKRLSSKSKLFSLIGFILVLAFPTASPLVFPTVSTASGDQTREQCEQCCRNAGHQEYYLDQCKLKCFRNPDHCVDRKAGRPVPEESARPEEAAPEAPRRVPAETRTPVPGARTIRPAPPGQGTVPPAAAGTAPSGEPPRRAPETVQLVWPSPLNLVPGREAEAAGQILALNGIPPQNPNYAAALTGIQNVLINFARSNPGGGKLPTAELARILMQFK